MPNRRTFIQHLAALGITSPFAYQTLEKILANKQHLAPEVIAQDETFWAEVRSGYRLKPDYINLENGYYCFIPQETLENYIHHIRMINYEGSYYMRTNQWKNKNFITQRLAELAGCNADELAITRNTTESLDLVIGGQEWEAGDEALMALQDYGAMRDMFKLQSQKHGIINKEINLPTHPKSDSEIIELYANAITPKTKLLMVCHMVNISGQILPVRKIADMAHSKGVDVMVDGAHAFGHFEFNIPDLDCDYYGSSLHKWLSAPLGAGLLYVKKKKIPEVWPLFAETYREDDDIRRLNHTGTHPVATDLAIGNALDYYYKLGPARKEARLRYIQQYWTTRVRDVPKIMVNTPVEPHRSCGIANVGIEGMEPADLAKTLLDKYRIWTVAINRPGVRGCRITPNIYTSTKELDQFVAALKALAAG
ncbi:MAG: aminotransferase class V-fold PLP-dependent enzyme [Bacteroidota bacterium]